MHRSLALALSLVFAACGAAPQPATPTRPQPAERPRPEVPPHFDTPDGGTDGGGDGGLAALPSVEVPMPPAQPMTDGLTRSVELAPGALHVWVAPSIGGADMTVWTDATPTPQALPAGAEFDATAWATRVYVRSQDGQPVATMTGTIRYEYAQL